MTELAMRRPIPVFELVTEALGGDAGTGLRAYALSSVRQDSAGPKGWGFRLERARSKAKYWTDSANLSPWHGCIPRASAIGTPTRRASGSKRHELLFELWTANARE